SICSPEIALYLIHHGLPRHMRYTLQSVIDVQAGHHHQEAIRIHTSDQSCNDKTIPALVRLIHQRIDCVCNQERHRNDVQILERNLVVLLRLLLQLRKLVFVLKSNFLAKQSAWGRSNLDVDGLCDFPGFQENTETLT